MLSNAVYPLLIRTVCSVLIDACPWRSILPCGKIVARCYCRSSDENSHSVLVRTYDCMQRTDLRIPGIKYYAAFLWSYVQARCESFCRRMDNRTEQLSYCKEVSTSTGKYQRTLLYVGQGNDPLLAVERASCRELTDGGVPIISLCLLPSLCLLQHHFQYQHTRYF